MDSKKASRRKFLKGGAAAAAVGAIQSASGQTPAPAPVKRSLKDEVAYGERSHYVTSVRVAVLERPSPDEFGLTFHVLTPLQDQVGIITPSSLHFVGTHRGAIVPDIDPREYRFLLHGMVDRPLEFTLEELKRFPSVSRIHFVECLGNRARADHKTVQQTHGLTSCSEWTGVLLSVLLKECGVQKGANWVVSEGAEEVKGAGSIPLAKAMDDCLVAYGQNGEAIRPQNGFPVRLIVPGFEGIYNTKWLRRIKVVDHYYMTYNDYGHISKDPKVAGLNLQWGPKSVITFPSGGQKLPGPGVYQLTGLAWSGGGAVRKVEVSADGGHTWKDAEIRSQVHRMAHTRFGMTWKWEGQECMLQSRCTDELGQVQPTKAQLAKFFNQPPDYYHTHGVQGTDNTIQPWRVAADGSVSNAFA
ncbi:MAG: sulfite dehydrogenase [Acidobacteria bacterium]|nr:MAG: sulfite dehydrogenase [Acidobacteriota bacterium]PYS16161.1 MAG: sulfite dehydrogenase [Acidobacteriota bacterium]